MPLSVKAHFAKDLPSALMYGASVDQDINCRVVGRCVHAELSRAGLGKPGLSDIDPEKVSQFDSVKAIGDLRRTGQRVAQEIKLEDFGDFVRQVKGRGGKVVHLATKQLFGL